MIVFNDLEKSLINPIIISVSKEIDSLFRLQILTLLHPIPGVYFMEMNQQPDLNLRDNDGLIKLECYRIEKEWNDLKSRIKNNLVCLYKEKRLLDEWFKAFAELLDLKNEKFDPLSYH